MDRWRGTAEQLWRTSGVTCRFITESLCVTIDSDRHLGFTKRTQRNDMLFVLLPEL